jgi:phosphoribosylformylglycinamidine synthase
MYLAKVFVMLKPSVLDPQGTAVTRSLRALGYTGVTDTRVGKFLEVTVDANNESAAHASVTEMCERLLANPTIETYRFELSEVEPCASR